MAATPVATRLASSARNGRRARRLPAAATAARTAAPARRREAVRGRQRQQAWAPTRDWNAPVAGWVDVLRQRRSGHRQVADLARRAADTAVQPSAEHGGQAEADADPDQHEVVDARGRADRALGHRGQVDVVLDRHRPAQVGAQRVEHALVPGGQVHGQPQVTGARVEHAGGADHERPQRLRRHPGRAAGRRDRAAHQLDRVAAPFGSTEISATTGR